MDKAVSLALSASAETMLTESHIGSLTTCRPDGSPHVAPVRFTWDRDAGLVRVMTVGTRAKARNILADPHARASVCQLVGYRWVTLEGLATVSDEPDRLAEGVRRYAHRYRSFPPDLPGLVVIEIAVDRVLGQN
jgi:PPOX class probable F420-dependent enzyme